MPQRRDATVLRPDASDAIVFFLLWLTYAYFFQGGFSNQNSRFDLSMSLAFEHRFTIDTFHENTIDKVLVGGHYFTEKAPLVSYLALPVPLIASLFWTTEEVLQSTRLSNGLLYLATVASVSLLSAVAGVFFRRILLVVNPGLSRGAATLFALATFAGTLALPYSTMLFGHQVAAAWLTLALFFAITSGDRQRPRRAAVCFFLLGLAVVTEYPVLPAAIAVAVIVLVRQGRDWKRLLPSALSATVPLGLLLLHNFATFGHPWRLGYGALQGTQFAAGMSRGLFGVGLPSLRVAGQLLFGLYRGLFVYSPLLVLAAIAFPRWPRQQLRAIALPLLAGCLGVVAIISGYSFWQGGTCFGPRHLVATIPLLAVGVAHVPARWHMSPWPYAAISVSFAVSLLGTAITPSISEFELSPLTHAYLPLVLAGDVAIGPMDFLTPFSESSQRFASGWRFPDASWNWGELLGLRGFWSLVPLALAWALAAVLLRRLRTVVTWPDRDDAHEDDDAHDDHTHDDGDLRPLRHRELGGGGAR